MAVTISASDVTTAYPATAAVDSTMMDGFIALVDQADACLDANGVSVVLQTSIKVAAVAHLATQSIDQSSVKSAGSATGASVTYKDSRTTPQWALLKSLDQYGCVTSLLDDGSGIDVFFGSTVGHYESS